MASFLTHVLEGQNLSELEKMAQDGDLRHLGLVARNQTLINIHERFRAESALREAERKAEEAQEAVRREELDRAQAEQYEENRKNAEREAARLEEIRRLPKERRVALLQDSDEAVDDFLSNNF